MAVRTWLSTNGSLTSTAAWSGATVPVAGDYVRVPKQATLAPNANLNGLASEALAGWYVEDGCPIPFGSSGNPIHIDADEIVWFGDGPAYVQHTGTAGTNSLLYAPVSEMAMLSLLGNAVGTTVIVSGNFDMSTVSTSSVLMYVCRNPRGLGPKMRVASSVTLGSGSQVIQQGGEIIDSSTGTIAKIVHMGGSYEKLGAGAITAWYGMGGAMNFHSTGGVGLAEAMRGTFDVSQGIETRTVTLARVHPGAKYLVDYNITTVTTEQILLDEVGIGPSP